MTTLPLQCQCGRLRGELLDATPRYGQHVICYCDDCQTAAHHLGAAEAVLDPYGGTPVFQTTPNKVRWTQGTEHLRCLRLSPKGLHRFYAGCCHTPVGNLLGPKVPFVGLHAITLPEGAIEHIGPVTAAMQAAHAQGDPPGAAKKVPIGLMAKTALRAPGWLLTRAHKPSAYFDDAGEPVVSPEILTLEQRNAARAKAGG